MGAGGENVVDLVLIDKHSEKINPSRVNRYVFGRDE